MPYCPNGRGEVQSRFCLQCGAAPGDGVRVRSDDHRQSQAVQVHSGGANAGAMARGDAVCGRSPRRPMALWQRAEADDLIT